MMSDEQPESEEAIDDDMTVSEDLPEEQQCLKRS